jgi:hypothetical protein
MNQRVNLFFLAFSQGRDSIPGTVRILKFRIKEQSVMADDKETKQCKHPPCSCPAAEDGDYCSAICEGSGDTTTIDCDCGHPACSGDF